jgi:hypothetical protein
VSVASAEEVQNAMANQDHSYGPKQTDQLGPKQTEKKPVRKATPKQIEYITKAYGENLPKLLAKHKIKQIEEMPISVASDIIKKIKEAK